MHSQDLHVVLALHDKFGEYSRHVAVVMVSILENTMSNVHFHIFHDTTLKTENINKLKEICIKHNQNIQFHHIELPINDADLNNIEHISIGTLYRLDIAKQLKNISKALYLDGDIVVHLDVKELFDIDMQGKAIMAVRDEEAVKNPKFYTLDIPVNVAKYFNAGVILFDLEKIRQEYNLLDDCLNIIKKYPKDYFTDQSALNHFLQNDCLLVDERYNSFPSKTNDDVNKLCIWHLAGNGKPWAVRQYKVDMLYWQYFKLTPWIQSDEDLFNYFSKTVIPLEDALFDYPIVSRRLFFKHVGIRVMREIKKIKNIKRKLVNLR